MLGLEVDEDNDELALDVRREVLRNNQF